MALGSNGRMEKSRRRCPRKTFSNFAAWIILNHTNDDTRNQDTKPPLATETRRPDLGRDDHSEELRQAGSAALPIDSRRTHAPHESARHGLERPKRRRPRRTPKPERENKRWPVQP